MIQLSNMNQGKPKWREGILRWIKELDFLDVGLGAIMLIGVVGMAACAVLLIYYVSKLAN
jgi:hypothetical protein